MRPYTLRSALLSPGRWRKAGINAIRAAWRTFAMSMLGWEVSSYVFRVWPDCGRYTGEVTHRMPVYPRDADLPPMLGGIPVSGWGLSAEGTTWRTVWSSPVGAITSGHEAVLFAVDNAEQARRGAR